MKVYLLSHSREVEQNVYDTKAIGIYSSSKKIKETIEKYKNIMGFKDYPENFVVEEFDIEGSTKKKKIMPGELIYFLQHEYTIDEYDYVTDIGMYLKRSEARKVMKKLIKKKAHPYYPGGIYPPYGYNIDKCIVDEDNWNEGFIACDLICEMTEKPTHL